MKLIEKKENEIVFSNEIESELANAIRRYINHIPILAIDEVEIEKNDSPLYDETVAHRLGLVPLEMKNISDAKNAKIKLSVAKEGYVYSGEMKGIQPVYDKIPITYLNKEQELALTATVTLGKGSEHAKFSPGIMTFRNAAEITMNKEFLDNVKKVCPKNEIKEKGDKIIVYDNQKKEVLDVCEGISINSGKKAEVEYKDELIVSLESFGQIDVKTMFKKAIEELKKDLAKAQKEF